MYDLLDKIGQSVPLKLFSATQVGLSATVKVAADKPSKQVTFRITYQNSCSLKCDDLDLKLREVLVVSGIEPKEPAGVCTRTPFRYERLDGCARLGEEVQ